MLINKKEDILVNDVVSFRLVNGDEIIGKLFAETPTSITISKPISIQMQMVSPQQAGIAFAPFMASNDEENSLTFPKDKLLTNMTKTRKDIRDNYISATTGIVVPKTGIIT